MVVIVVRQAADRDESVGAGLAECDEQPSTGDAVDAAAEGRADALGEKRGSVAVRGAALGSSSAALGHGNVLSDGDEILGLGRRQSAGTKIETRDERAVHQEIGVAADRRGEMRIAPQRQTEMADILRAVRSLRLAAQDELVDQGGVGGTCGAAQNLVEMPRL